jgi:hypothetical protein
LGKLSRDRVTLFFIAKSFSGISSKMMEQLEEDKDAYLVFTTLWASSIA